MSALGLVLLVLGAIALPIILVFSFLPAAADDEKRPIREQVPSYQRYLGSVIPLITFVVLFVGGVASLLFSWTSGIPWSGLALAVFLLGTSARSASLLLLLHLRTRATKVLRIGQTLQAFAYVGAGLLFLPAALTEGWSALLFAAGCAWLATIHFFIAKRLRFPDQTDNGISVREIQA